MAAPMTAHSSFVYLVDNIPEWQQELNALSERARAKNLEFIAEYSRLVSENRPKRKKSASISSIHTLDGQQNEAPTVNASTLALSRLPKSSLPLPQDQVDKNLCEAGNKNLGVPAQRKRKPDTTIRTGASGPQKFRTKTQVVVYFDGIIQERLDSMVRSVGYGRNNLRKGKIALTASRGFRLPQLTRATVRGIGYGENVRARNTAALLLGKKTEDSTDTGSVDHDTIFLQVDKELESIQSLCETAAHQFLRDGDCNAELEAAQAKLKEIYTKAVATAESLQKLEEEQLKKKDTLDCLEPDLSFASDSDNNTLSTKPSLDILHTPKLTAEHPTHISHTLDDMKSRGAFFGTSQLPSGPNPPLLMADNIEVDDDSDEDDFVVDISAYRVANARRARV